MKSLQTADLKEHLPCRYVCVELGNDGLIMIAVEFGRVKRQASCKPRQCRSTNSGPNTSFHTDGSLLRCDSHMSLIYKTRCWIVHVDSTMSNHVKPTPYTTTLPGIFCPIISCINHHKSSIITYKPRCHPYCKTPLCKHGCLNHLDTLW